MRRKEAVYWLMKLRSVGLVRVLLRIYADLQVDISSDNYSMLLSHFTRQHGVDPSDIRAVLGIREDYEDIC